MGHDPANGFARIGAAALAALLRATGREALALASLFMRAGGLALDASRAAERRAWPKESGGEVASLIKRPGARHERRARPDQPERKRFENG